VNTPRHFCFLYTFVPKLPFITLTKSCYGNDLSSLFSGLKVLSFTAGLSGWYTLFLKAASSKVSMESKRLNDRQGQDSTESGNGIQDPLAWAVAELLRQVQIPSFSGEEALFTEYLCRRSEELDFRVVRDSVSPDRDNLIVGWTDKPTLALMAHTDTIRPRWEHSGKAEIRGTEVWGLGAVDDKGSIVALLLGLVLAREAGVPLQRLPMIVAFTVDEEGDGTGSLALARTFRPRYALVLEGTGLDLAVAEAGHLDVRIVVRGTSVHTGEFEHGDSALEKAARLVTELNGLPLAEHSDPLIGRSAFNAISFHSGTSELNALPDRAELYLVGRLGRGLSVRQALDQLRTLGDRYDAEVILVDTPIPGLMECSEPIETPESSPLLGILQQEISEIIGHPPQLFGTHSWTDAHNLFEAGAQTAVFGPGDPKTAHGKNEHIDVRQIVLCARIIRGILIRLWREDL
jgi:acetylornithine deacetylase/succinyl-diaminopimelate desuccinylase-like protein